MVTGFTPAFFPNSLMLRSRRWRIHRSLAPSTYMKLMVHLTDI